jgi:hypothetical protein
MKRLWIIIGVIVCLIPFGEFLWTGFLNGRDGKLMRLRGAEARLALDAIYGFAETNNGVFPHSLNELFSVRPSIEASWASNFNNHFLYIQPPPHDRLLRVREELPIIIEKPGHYSRKPGGILGYAGNGVRWLSNVDYPRFWDEIGESSNRIWRALALAQTPK